MVVAATNLARRLIAERHVAIRSRGRIRYLTLTRRAQLAGLCIGLLGISSVAAVTLGYVASDRKASLRAAVVAQAEMSNEELRDLIAKLQDRLDAASRDGEQMRSRLAFAMSQNSALRGELYGMEARLRSLDETRADLQQQRETSQSRLKVAEDALAAKSSLASRLGQNLEGTKSDLKQTEQQRQSLAGRVHQLESDLQAATKEVAQLRGTVEASDRKLQQVASEREKLTAERDGLLGRMVASAPARGGKVRGEKLVLDTASAISSGGAPAAGPSPSGMGQGLAGLETEGRRGWVELARLLTSAGVDLDKLAARYGAVAPGQGGPFIALKNAKVNTGDPPEGLKKMLKALPLSAPLSQYQLESRFGVRVDPFNHRQSMHTGLDFAAPYRTPIYNTAPGTVIFAGPKGEYGKVVDIDHGSGIVTRYAHLHRITVALGQHLTSRSQIGLLGSTGRSTGPHVHYEVLVNGVAQDPEKFLEAGKNALQISANSQ